MIKYKDRNEETEMLRMALNMCDIGLDYHHVELLLEVQEKLKKKGDNFNLKDGVNLYYDWAERWHKYFENQK